MPPADPQPSKVANLIFPSDDDDDDDDDDKKVKNTDEVAVDDAETVSQ